MDTRILEKHFAQMGARVKINSFSAAQSRGKGIDIRSDRRGEFFEITIDEREKNEFEVVALKRDARHLVLLERQADGAKNKFLCGHDERHWFVCAVPGRSVTTVETAMESLQPLALRRQIARQMKRIKNRFTRRNEIFRRQGEWFFIPTLRPWGIYRRNEPLSRGAGSKPHVCEEALWNAGFPLMICPMYPNGVQLSQYERILKHNPKAKRWDWVRRQANGAFFARGKVRHADHKTIVLDGWHQVLMNTEGDALGAGSVIFLD